MAVPIEARAYGPDSTPEEIEALRARVIYDPAGFVVYDEIPVFTPFSLGVMFEKVAEIEREHGLKNYAMFVDLSDTHPPDAAARDRVRELLEERSEVARLAVFSGMNMFLNVAVKFVASRFLKNKKLDIFKSRDQALLELRRG